MQVNPIAIRLVILFLDALQEIEMQQCMIVEAQCAFENCEANALILNSTSGCLR